MVYGPALHLERAEARVAELERRLELLEAVVLDAGYRPEAVTVEGRLEYVLVPYEPGVLMRAALEAWEAGVEEGEWS